MLGSHLFVHPKDAIREPVTTHLDVCRQEISRIHFIGAKNTSYIQSDLFNKLAHQYLITNIYFWCIAFKCLNLSFATHKQMRLIVF